MINDFEYNKVRKSCGFCGSEYCIGYQLRLSKECSLMFFKSLDEKSKKEILDEYLKNNRDIKDEGRWRKS